MNDTSPGHSLFINNRFRGATHGETIEVLDPSDGAAFSKIARGAAQDIDLAVRSARRAFDGDGIAEGSWACIDAAERGRLLARIGLAIGAQCDMLAAIESRDTGKPLRQARADAAALARYFEFYAGACDKLHGQTLPYRRGYTVMSLREPHGVTGHIIPWNYPMQIFGRSVGAALAAGNACVVKPAEQACLSLLQVARIAAECGLPSGVLSIVTGLGVEAGQALASHPGVDHLSFTGSPQTGSLVAQCAAAHHCPVTLELGGKSPQILFADADLDAALPAVVSAIIQNAGQTCSAGSRVLIEKPIYELVLEQLATRFRRLKAGPAISDHDLGPLISAHQAARVRLVLDQARAEGIETVASGTVVADAPSGGFYQAPVLLANVPRESSICQEEVFGPVLSAHAFDDEADALGQANGTAYGLVAGVWTHDGARQLRLARKLRGGQIFINDYGAGGGVELPFGGVGRSGHGREKGFEALYAFTCLKTIALRHG